MPEGGRWGMSACKSIKRLRVGAAWAAGRWDGSQAPCNPGGSALVQSINQSTRFPQQQQACVVDADVLAKKPRTRHINKLVEIKERRKETKRGKYVVQFGQVLFNYSRALFCGRIAARHLLLSTASLCQLYGMPKLWTSSLSTSSLSRIRTPPTGRGPSSWL